MKNIYCIVGVSGSGKTTVVEALEQQCGFVVVNSYTTRPKRHPNETGHIFVTDEEFNRLPNLCAFTEFNGYRYGVPASMIDESDLYVIDIPGVNYLKESYMGPKSIKVVGLRLPPIDANVPYDGPNDFTLPEREAYRRMLCRGDTAEKAVERVIHDRHMFADFDVACDYYVEAKDVDKTVETVMRFILSNET